ncbi:BspA family leucine-rich repeat surface protein [Flagellimonas sp.]|uniref:BspA family leucine-rich repeat surface protein n=1 Tax=Flagellimonas sp. TaxID=2058762 RepID=UPI003B52A7D4
MKLKILFPIMLFGLVFLASCEKDKVQENRPPQITVLEYDAQENSSPVDVITTIQASDADADALSFAIVTNDNDLFVISDRGELRVANGQSLDYNTATSHEIVISVSDGAETTTATITINVINTNQAPQISSQAFEVYEDASSIDIIGTLDAEDPDGDEIMFEIITNDNDLFAINSNGELFLADGASLDYETVTSHAITVEVSDGGKTEQGVITINVLNVIDDPYHLEESSFVFTMETTEANESVTLGIAEGGDYNYILDWGDGTIEEVTGYNTLPEHTYTVADVYSISINTDGIENGAFSRILWDNSPPNAAKVKSIEQWGTIEWESFTLAFRGCTDMIYNAEDAPDLKNVTSLYGMFVDASSFNGDLNNWDVSSITSTAYMFFGASSFNQDLSNWDVSKVEIMTAMFDHSFAFDQNLGGWDIRSVQTMEHMFTSSGLSKENYSKTLVGWEAQEFTPIGITLGATGLVYCGAEAIAARDILTDPNGLDWGILGDTECPPDP